MKSVSRLSSTVRAACQHTTACVSWNPPLGPRGSGARCADVPGRRVVVQQPRVTAVRPYHSAYAKSAVARAAPPPTPVALQVEGGDVHQVVRRTPPAAAAAAHVSPYGPHGKQQGSAAAGGGVQSLFEGDAIPELCSRLEASPSDDRAEGPATLLGACGESGLGAQSPVVQRLMRECPLLLSTTGGLTQVAELCHLGEVAHSLEGRRSAVVTEVLNSVGAAVEEDAVSPDEAVRVYSLLALCYDPASQRQACTLATLHRRTLRLVHRLTASQVTGVLQSLLKLRQRQNTSLVLRLSLRASQVFSVFSDDEIMKVLSALMILGQHHGELLAAMEKHLPGRLGECDPELISTVMEYCLQMRCRSETIFEAVAENFVRHAERHTTPQIAKQTVAMGRLNYLPECSSQMFKKLEGVLSTRFSQFQPRSLIEVLHACIHLERFPLNYTSRVFSPYFLQTLQAQGEPLDRKALAQLTQLHLSTSLECKHYLGPRLPHFLQVKRFSSVDQAFETPMDSLVYKQVKWPLTRLLGGKFFSTAVLTPSGYTIDVEVCLDEDGFVLPPSQWAHTNRRVALCLDGRGRFCSNTQHLLGKEATKRRHLRRMGYEVVQIPHFELEKPRTQKELIQYLHNKIFPAVFKFNR